MPQLEASAIVPLSPADAFTLAHTVGDERAAWDPAIAVSRWLRGATGPAEGAAVFTKAPSGRRRILRYELVEPNRLSSARLIKGQSHLADYGEGVRVEPDDHGSTITWKVVFKLRTPV
ncbi:MAG: SRPBCC family protein, partial [Pseudoclavibacter sp.]